MSRPIKCVDFDDYQRAKEGSHKTIALLGDRITEHKKEAYLYQKQRDIAVKLLSEERAKQQAQQIERVGGNDDDWGKMLADSLQRAMAPLTSEMTTSLDKQLEEFSKNLQR